MTLCSDACIPCCDYCKYAIHDQIFVNDKWQNEEPVGCQLHPGRESLCSDFYCCLVDESSDPTVVVEGLITTIWNEIYSSPYNMEYVCEDGTVIRTDVEHLIDWFEEYQDVLRRRYGIKTRECCIEDSEAETLASSISMAFSEIEPGDKVEIYE